MTTMLRLEPRICAFSFHKNPAGLNEFDHKAQGSCGALDWRTKLVSQRGVVMATEMKNNSYKLGR
jgi:hypothetical protein